MRKRYRVALRMLGMAAALLLVAAGWLWLRFRPDSMGRVVPLFEQIDRAVLPQFTNAVISASSIQVFEGLPHPSWEKETFASELSTKNTFKSQEHRFYSLVIVPSGEDLDAIRSHSHNPVTFEEWGGMKTCGGYHPDWMVRWTTAEGAVHELNLCFRCREAKLYGPQYQLYCDLKKESLEQLKIIFARYASQRP